MNAAITIVYAVKLIPSVISFDFAIIVLSQLNLQLFPLTLEPIFTSKCPEKRNSSRMNAYKRRVCVRNEDVRLRVCTNSLEGKRKLLTLHRFRFAIKQIERGKNETVNGYLFEQLIDLKNAFILWNGIFKNLFICPRGYETETECRKSGKDTAESRTDKLAPHWSLRNKKMYEIWNMECKCAMLSENLPHAHLKHTYSIRLTESGVRNGASEMGRNFRNANALCRQSSDIWLRPNWIFPGDTNQIK